MARGGTVFISTNPQNNVPIGTPGQGVFIGHPGQLIYGASGGAVSPSGTMILSGLSGSLTFIPTTVPVVVEF
jgi:hypothetical protein